MYSQTLSYPEGYQIMEDSDIHILYRPDGTEVLRFDPAMVWECTVVLAAFEDHSQRLMEGYRRSPTSQLRCSP